MTQSQNSAPLADLLVAMDVVDTLRHERDLALNELNSENRRKQLKDRLREIYHAQGMQVTDALLEEGILALEQERFSYKPPKLSFATRLAHVWVKRRVWSRPLGFLSVVAGLFAGIYTFTDVLPERAERQQIPISLEKSITSIIAIAKDKSVIEQAQESKNTAMEYYDDSNFEKANEIARDLDRLRSVLISSYTVRVVSGANRSSGVWRVPPNNQLKKNYYLIVEAVDTKGEVVEVEILNEENNEIANVKAWGLGVEEFMFNRIRDDKLDDGIIQNNIVGTKPRGELDPIYSLPVTGGYITEW